MASASVLRPREAPASGTSGCPEASAFDADGYLPVWRNIDDITLTLAMRAQSTASADPTRIFPPHGGAGFSLHECVRVLFDITTEDLTDAAA